MEDTWRHGDLDDIERDLGLRDAVGESETVARHRSAFTRDWTKQLGADLSDQPPREPWPAPEVAAREARSDEVPPPAQKLAEVAEANGWATRVVFSRGTSQAGRVDNPEHGPVVDAVSVRCRCRRGFALGYWRNGRWAFGLCVEFAEGVPFRIETQGELRALLSDRNALR